jgi:hypothetical protein
LNPARSSKPPQTPDSLQNTASDKLSVIEELPGRLPSENICLQNNTGMYYSENHSFLAALQSLFAQLQKMGVILP